MIRAIRLALAGLATATMWAPAAAAQDELVVTITPTVAELRLGEETTLRIEVHNAGSTTSAALAVHIDVTDPTGAGSVDPEDWTPTLTRRIDPVPPGSSRHLDWRIQPISGGTFRAYAVALPVDGGPEVHASNGVVVRVEERRSLNPEGVLPIALGAPLVVGALLATRLPRLRRSG